MIGRYLLAFSASTLLSAGVLAVTVHSPWWARDIIAGSVFGGSFTILWLEFKR